jgi:hypothetical protein
MLSGEAPIAVRTMAILTTVEQFEDIAIYRAWSGPSSTTPTSSGSWPPTLRFVRSRRRRGSSSTTSRS